jgi:hypothetical protein
MKQKSVLALVLFIAVATAFVAGSGNRVQPEGDGKGNGVYAGGDEGAGGKPAAPGPQGQPRNEPTARSTR